MLQYSIKYCFLVLYPVSLWRTKRARVPYCVIRVGNDFDKIFCCALHVFVSTLRSSSLSLFVRFASIPTYCSVINIIILSSFTNLPQFYLQEVMKYIGNLIVDVGTLALAVLGAVRVHSVVGEKNATIKDDDNAIVAKLFAAVAFLFCFTNLFGIHMRQVQKNWEGFGEKFFPTQKMNNDEKRVVAGSLELIALIFTMLKTPLTRAIGYAVLVTMYGRGALVQAQISRYNRSAIVGVSAAVAAWLLFQQHQATVLVE